MFSNSRLGTDEGRFGCRVHQNEERRKSKYFMIYSKITPYTQLFKPFENLHRWICIRKRTSSCCFYLFIPEFKTEQKKRFLLWKGKIDIYCIISCTINGFIIIIVNLSVTLFNILFCVDTKVVLYLLHFTDSEVRFM